MSEVVPEPSLEARTSLCPACSRRTARRRELCLQREPQVELEGCEACGASSASRLPTHEFCTALYETGYAAEHVQVTQGNAQSFSAHVLGLLRDQHLPATLSMLDFGGSDGSMAYALARALLADGRVTRVRVVVIDHVVPVVSSDRRIELSAIARLDALPQPVSFDFVLASAVLEHIPHLAPVLEQLLSKVARGGLFYARTPWVAPLVKLIPRLPLMLWPVHVHDLGRPFWNRLHERFPDFETVCSRPSWVETSFREAPLRTAAAHLLKLPGRLDARLRPRYRGRLGWGLVGGWEVLLRRARA
ncbi:MAG: Methyltransferase type 12 [Myxococcaceae bacterium]|nr:Methyltransferase type 12 [Myxococcaceae bacterium]